MKLTMWLDVIPPDAQKVHYSLHGIGTLWVRDVDTICVPTLDDQVTLWPEDGHPGPMWGVKRRYMGHDGVWHAELHRMLLDPPEAVVDQMFQKHRTTWQERTSSTWYTDRDGDPVPELERGGWRRYLSEEMR